MIVYSAITGAEECILDMSILVEDSYSGFSVAGGTGVVTDSSTGLLNSGFVFSGHEGYIFDQSGRFVGGYEANKSFKISIHSKSNDTYSYFIDDVLIANNYSGSTGSDYIEFDKHGSATLNIVHIFEDGVEEDNY